MICEQLFTAQREFEKDYGVLCGVDEAGRGPLAGPVCCAAAIMLPGVVIDGLNDSKKLSEKRREAMFDEIIANCLEYQVVFVDPATIDEINILRATLLGMKKAIEGLSHTPQLTLVDGNAAPDIATPCRTVIKGDATVACISAASVLAKVSRDRLMRRYAEKYPQYGFEIHKGYGTKAHYAAISEYGPCEIHRRTFLKGIC